MLTEPVIIRTMREWARPSVVNAREKSRKKNGAVKNLIGILAPDARGHGVTNMFGHANPIAKSLRRVGRKRRVIDLAVDRFHP